ncbi:protein of unknown function [Rosenbergiella nectarea]|uniref:DUF4055 domain-containing protein n=1 Tax=Rosenbergiella nectarea TaxID=988801 RepID=A0A1H9ENJ4_9GAMM|nr:DUF4055 domain-containing protein [Rosenbergiella nectarea]SEQ27172.1 protein of unknown function [Rosenbergiella nectarea]
MANYAYINPEYSEAKKSWDLVKDCVTGSRAVKKKQTAYLPMPDPTNSSEENKARYQALLNRAMFLNVTGRTRQGLIGAVFRKSAEINLPTDIDYVQTNASGDGVSLEQLSKAAIGECLDTGRGGFFVDYPNTDTESGVRPTKAQSAGNNAHAHHYIADQIINWREDVINGIKKLTMVAFAELYHVDDGDEFQFETKTQYRGLTLENGVYRHRVWRESEDVPILDTRPTDYNGKTFDHIPFYFYGSENNDACIDKSPLEDLAEVNILHYGNSATVEESGFISSQPTLIFTTDAQPSEFSEWNPNGIQIGSTSGYCLGKVGTAQMLQASEGNLSRTLMQDKENQMLMIGARIVQQSGQNETAEAARIRYSSDNSVLGTIAGNVSEAIKSALLDVQLYMSGTPTPDAIVFWLNQEFFDEAMDAQMILAQVQLWQQGIIAKSDIRTNLRQAAIIDADRTDKDIDTEREAEPPVSGVNTDTIEEDE